MTSLLFVEWFKQRGGPWPGSWDTFSHPHMWLAVDRVPATAADNMRQVVRIPKMCCSSAAADATTGGTDH